MDNFLFWFQNLSYVTQALVILILLPIALFLLGALMAGVGDMPETLVTGKENPAFCDYVVGSMKLGVVGAIPLISIFGCFKLLYMMLTYTVGETWWRYTVSFIISLILVLRLLFWYASKSPEQ